MQWAADSIVYWKPDLSEKLYLVKVHEDISLLQKASSVVKWLEPELEDRALMEH